MSPLSLNTHSTTVWHHTGKSKIHNWLVYQRRHCDWRWPGSDGSGYHWSAVCWTLAIGHSLCWGFPIGRCSFKMNPHTAAHSTFIAQTHTAHRQKEREDLCVAGTEKYASVWAAKILHMRKFVLPGVSGLTGLTRIREEPLVYLPKLDKILWCLWCLTCSLVKI